MKNWQRRKVTFPPLQLQRMGPAAGHPALAGPPAGRRAAQRCGRAARRRAAALRAARRAGDAARPRRGGDAPRRVPRPRGDGEGGAAEPMGLATGRLTARVKGSRLQVRVHWTTYAVHFFFLLFADLCSL